MLKIYHFLFNKLFDKNVYYKNNKFDCNFFFGIDIDIVELTVRERSMDFKMFWRCSRRS